MGLDAFTLMGWSSIPNVATDFYAARKFDDLVMLRLHRAPIARATTIYIRYSASGNGSGGGGSGTSADPYLCRSASHIHALITSTAGGGDKCYDLGGDEYRRGPSSSGAETGISLTAGSVTIMNGTLSGFDDPYPNTGWTNEGSGAWSRTESTAVYHVVDGAQSWAASVAEGGYAKYASLTEVQGGAKRWWWDSATNKLYVNTGDSSNAPDFIRPCKVASSTAVSVDADFCRLHNIQAYGWGNNAAPTSGPDVLMFQPTGTGAFKEAVFSGCTAHFGPWHIIGSRAGSGAAGSLTCIDCDAGNSHNTVNTTSPTVFVSYAPDRSPEMVMVRCRSTYATLDYPNTRPSTGDRYAQLHTAHTNGVSRIGLQLLIDCETPDSARGCNVFATFSNIPDITDPYDPGEYRVVLLNCTGHPAASGRLDGVYAVFGAIQYRCRWTHRPHSASAFSRIQAISNSGNSDFLMLNTILDIDLSQQTADWLFLMQSAAGTPIVRGAIGFSRIHFRDRAASGNVELVGNTYGSNSWGFGRVKTFNSIITRSSATSFNAWSKLPRKRIGAAVSDPVTNPGEHADGGTNRCAVINLGSGDTTGWHRTITLSSAPDNTYRPEYLHALWRTAELDDVPTALVPKYDYNGKRRHPTTASVGPVEAIVPESARAQKGRVHRGWR